MRDLESDKRLARSASLATVPVLRKNIVERAYNGDASPRQAIKAKCYECVNYENIRDEVLNCPCYTCPLWEYRPFRHDKTQKS